MPEYIDEFKYEYRKRIDSSMCTLGGCISPVGIQRLCVCTVEEHLENVGLSIHSLMDNYGLSWVLLSLTVKVLSPIRLGDELVIHTKHIRNKGVIYKRELMLTRNGERVALAASFSTIIDIATRRICTNKHILDSLPIPPDSESFLDADHRHRVKESEFEFCFKEDVRPCQIDPVGHINNLRYADIVHDALPESVRARLKDINEFSIYFTGELKLSDSYKVMTKQGDDTFEVLGIRQSDLRTAFSAKLVFNEEK